MQVLNKSIFGLRSPLRRIIQINNKVKHLCGSCNEYKTKAIDLDTWVIRNISTPYLMSADERPSDGCLTVVFQAFDSSLSAI